jgi:hypothetical protein
LLCSGLYSADEATRYLATGESLLDWRKRERTTCTIEDGLGEFVSGYWALEEVADKATTQTLHWTEGDEYGTLKWQACD